MERARDTWTEKPACPFEKVTVLLHKYRIIIIVMKLLQASMLKCQSA
jgi:hypothetical protein